MRLSAGLDGRTPRLYNSGVVIEYCNLLDASFLSLVA